MERNDLEQLLDFATRDWRADWRGNFGGERGASRSGGDLVMLYVYVHRVSDCEPGVYRWDRASAAGWSSCTPATCNAVAAFLSLEQALAGNSCFTISMIADLDAAARVVRQSRLPLCLF